MWLDLFIYTLYNFLQAMALFLLSNVVSQIVVTVVAVVVVDVVEVLFILL